MFIWALAGLSRHLRQQGVGPWISDFIEAIYCRRIPSDLPSSTSFQICLVVAALSQVGSGFRATVAVIYDSSGALLKSTHLRDCPLNTSPVHGYWPKSSATRGSLQPENPPPIQKARCKANAVSSLGPWLACPKGFGEDFCMRDDTPKPCSYREISLVPPRAKSSNLQALMGLSWSFMLGPRPLTPLQSRTLTDLLLLRHFDMQLPAPANHRLIPTNRSVLELHRA